MLSFRAKPARGRQARNLSGGVSPKNREIPQAETALGMTKIDRFRSLASKAY